MTPFDPSTLVENAAKGMGIAAAIAAKLSDIAGKSGFIEKFSQIHDHKGTLIVFWHDAPTEDEKEFFAKAWASKIGDGSSNVEHEV